MKNTIDDIEISSDSDRENPDEENSDEQDFDEENLFLKHRKKMAKYFFIFFSYL